MRITEDILKLFGPEQLYYNPQTLDHYSKDYSLFPSKRPDCVVKARNAEEIQHVLKYAGSNGIPVVPSSSRVHFYGGTIPQKGGIVLDLTEMDRVLEIDELNRRVRIEVGLTWGKLSKRLEEKGLRVMMPLYPHPLRSVVTDLLEREVITNTVYEYGESLQGMEVVWPNGEVFRTGSASVEGYPESICKGVNPSGPGLDFYRLLQGAQGTMGVVTWANVKVEYLPKMDKIFFIPVSNISRGIEFLSQIMRLRVGQECFFLNRMNIALIFDVDFKKRGERVPPWTLLIVLSGFQRYPEEKIRYEEDLLRNLVKGEFQELLLLEELPNCPFSNLEIVRMLRRAWPDPLTYWKQRYKKGCQSLFFVTKPSYVEKFVGIVEALAIQSGYKKGDIGMYIQPIEQNRACHLEFNFYYDPENGPEKEGMAQLYQKAVLRCLNEGAHFTRPYGEASRVIYERAPEYVRTLKRVKAIFDPQNLMNPGRLCF
ncbi:MAG: FAD-binding oxidoreductase [Syntrophaceae bacterium]|nr:FAD-binding oxidoreductase [Syntrophaceae bacterium]